MNVIKKGAIDFIGLPKPNRKTLQSPQMNVVQAHQVHFHLRILIEIQLTKLVSVSIHW